MRYLLHFEATNEAGGKIDRSPGGAGAAIGKVLELLKPETFYVSVFRRELFIIINTDDIAVLSEAAHVIQLVSGTSPDVTPIMTANEAMTLLEPTIENAVKTTRELGL